MSKKLYIGERWKKHLKRRREYELRKAQQQNQGKKGHYFAQPRRAPKEKRRFVPLSAPRVFSMIENPQQMVAFITTLRLYADRNNVQLDLSGVEKMTSDAIAVLLATIMDLPEAKITGNQPNDNNARDILLQSGFFDHVKSREPLPPCTRGQIARRHSKKVEPAVARDLIRLGTNAIYGSIQRSYSAYRILIEGMNNTHNHAAKAKVIEKETWWATVYADLTRKTICFTFVDMGVGIFRSFRISLIKRAYKLIGIRDNTSILRDILQGKVQSSTGLPHRGKGLPAINRECQSNRIQSLVIVTNDVYANVSRGQYRLMATEFRGTLLYWEIGSL